MFNMRNKNIIPRRGEIWECDLNTGSNDNDSSSIQKGKRPCIIVSNEDANEHSSVIHIVPLTTKQKKGLPTHIIIPISCGVKFESTALCESMREKDKSSLIRKLGKCTDDIMKNIDIALGIQLGLKPFNDNNLNKNSNNKIKPSVNNERIKNWVLSLLEINRILKEKNIEPSSSINRKTIYTDLVAYCNKHGLDYKQEIAKYKNNNVICISNNNNMVNTKQLTYAIQ